MNRNSRTTILEALTYKVFPNKIFFILEGFEKVLKKKVQNAFSKALFPDLQFSPRLGI